MSEIHKRCKKCNFNLIDYYKEIPFCEECRIKEKDIIDLKDDITLIYLSGFIIYGAFVFIISYCIISYIFPC